MAVRAGLPSYNLSVCFADSSPSRGASGEEAKLCGMPRPPLGRGGGTASAVTERLSLARASRSGCPLYNLSVCFADSSPSRGASGEEAKLCEMPRPPLGRGGGTASAVTERLSRCWGSGQQSSQSRENQRIAQIINKQKRRRRFGSRQRRFAYSVNSGQWIRPWPRCCALPSCRRRRSGTRCSGPERSATQPG